jgi:uncharacterized membrane protein
VAHDLLELAGVGVLAAGFLLRVNPLLAVVLAAFAAGWAGGLSPVATLEALGHAFNANRYVGLVWLVLPVIGLLERRGLQTRARARVAALRGATAGRILLGYLLVRQLTAALGLTALGGHAQMVRPLLAPMAEAAADAEAPGGDAGEAGRRRVRALAASADNVGAFFGEDIFIAFGSVLLIRGVLAGDGVSVDPLRLSLWAIPTAFAAFAVHGWRLLRAGRGRSVARAHR